MIEKDTVKNIWNSNAKFWNEKMGEGNRFHKKLIEPVQLELLDIKKEHKILDIACGNGQFARKMASLGAEVLATDFSEVFISLAKTKDTQNIDFRVIDATKADDFDTLPGNFFDAIVCTMALMDMENIEILFSSLPRVLKKNGIFVFSVLHPCFNSGETILTHERDDLNGVVKNNFFIKTRNYLIEQDYLGIGMIGQPKPQYYFHRPVSTLLNLLFKNGFVLDRYEEPSFEKTDNPDDIFDNVYCKIPPVLICRARLR